MPSDATGDKSTGVTPAPEGDKSPASTPEPKSTTPPFEDAIVESVMAGKEPEIAPEPPPVPAKEPVPAPVKAEEPEPRKEGGVPPEPQAVDDPLTKLPKVRHPFDEEDDPDPEEFVDPAHTKIRASVTKLRDKLRAAREQGTFGSTMIGMAQKAGLNPDQMAWWVEVGARANTGDPQAISELAALMQRLGVPIGQAAQPEDALKAAAEQIYTEQFKPEVDNLELTEEKARELSMKLAKKTAPPPRPAPSQPAQTPTPPPAPRQQANPVVASANQAVASLEEQYRQVIRDYDAPDGTRAKALTMVAAKTAKTGPVPPIRWAYEWSSAVREILAQRAGIGQRQPVKPTDSLRPGRSTEPPKAGDFDAKRQEIAKAIMSGQLDQLE